MTEPLKFPLVFSKCPACGSERRVAEMVGDEEVEKKKVSPQIQMAMISNNVAIADPARAMLSAPVLTVLYDVCADCGTLYAKYVGRKDMSLQDLGNGPAGPIGNRPMNRPRAGMD